MIFDWHDEKHEGTLRERGFGFDFAALVFEGRVLTQIDDRQDYGEIRVKAIGEVDGVVLVVIYTDREDVRWIISARKANKKERALWLA
ncbi:MAG TPA: BrnT family toxin [Bradyrhizobium sp.]|nr:BrnT family toxin [Bradyrhizobium sp.]